MGQTTLRKDFGQQPRQELSGHNDKRRVKLLVLLKDDIGIIIADELAMTVGDDLGITVGVADATPNLVVTITHSVRGHGIYRTATVLFFLIKSSAQVIEKEERRLFRHDEDVSSSRWNQWCSGHT
jgi:hypothetical protein